jgi:hypothetical protein
MTAQTISFPSRGPFTVIVEREETAWLVLCRSHGWLYGDFAEAIRDAYVVAHGFGVAVKVVPT